MTARDFAFWLQGVFEIGGLKSMNEVQTDTVRRHLALVFKHEIDPSMGDAEVQVELNKIHAPATSAGFASSSPLMRC